MTGAPSPLTFTIPGEPVSKSRARFTGYGSKTRAYTPARTLAGERAVALAFNAAGGRFEPDREVTFRVEATFYNGTRHRRDVDNMIKLILDALNGVAWVDDMQVMEVEGRKRFTAKAEARTEVTLAVMGQMDRLTRTCEECEIEFITYLSWGEKRHCSNACTLRQRRLARIRTCEHCGTSWDPGKPSQAKYCSRECHNAHGRADTECYVCGAEFRTARSGVARRNFCSADCRRKQGALDQKARRTTHFPGVCAICGAGTTRKEYRRCNLCKLAGLTEPDGGE